MLEQLLNKAFSVSADSVPLLELLVLSVLCPAELSLHRWARLCAGALRNEPPSRRFTLCGSFPGPWLRLQCGPRQQRKDTVNSSYPFSFPRAEQAMKKTNSKDVNFLDPSQIVTGEQFADFLMSIRELKPSVWLPQEVQGRSGLFPKV